MAVGAIVVLVFRPEALAGASFSFAAVTAIIAVHSSDLGKRLFARRDEGLIARAARMLLTTVATGLVVEFALMPFALYHFHKAGLYGVAANLVAIPLTTFVIMPLEAGALMLDSIGAGAPLWWLAGLSIEALLWIARNIASAGGAVATLAAMPGWSFALMVTGALWLCLWTTRPRLFRLLPFAIGAVGAALSPTPDVLVTGDGRHLAVLTPDGTPMMLRDRAGDFMLVPDERSVRLRRNARSPDGCTVRRLLPGHVHGVDPAGRQGMAAPCDADIDPAGVGRTHPRLLGRRHRGFGQMAAASLQTALDQA